METKISTFKPVASFPTRAIVMFFDLEGFSQFFSQPDVQDYVPQFLNIVLEAVDIVLNGGKPYWQNKPTELKGMPSYIHSKFLGDGGLYIWNYNDFSPKQMAYLVNRLYNLKSKFSHIVKKAEDVISVVDIPQKIRIGLAAGSIYKLTYESSDKEEFIGYSINLASRLQKYCREIGFIFSARLDFDSTILESNNYTKKIAKKIKGFPKEYVVVDKDDFNNLSEEEKLELFD